jgi:uncharacterized protein (DUF1800 family)
MADARQLQKQGAWEPYAPTAGESWDIRRVVHLHRRAGFAATWGEVQRDLQDGVEKSVGRLLSGRARAEGMPADFDTRAGRLAHGAVAARAPERLKGWWIYRMLFGPDPLGERLVLLWHDHFATSNLKVRDLAAMHRQNEAFRDHARSRFGDLLRAVVKDQALLVWLDADVNRKGQPNENLGREMMELFTLGVGNYEERDVKESARCLTGWTLKDGRFHEDPSQHDDGDKAVLGRRGRLNGDDLLGILLERPATAERLAWRLCDAFLAPGAFGPEDVKALATDLRDHGLDIGRAVGTLLRSRTFFAEKNIGGRILGPVEYVVGAARALELFDPSPNTLVLADWAARLGQDLFYPPNVFGWPGGRAWINTRTAVQRTRYAAALVDGAAVGRPVGVDAVALAGKHGRGSSGEDVLGFYLRLLLGRELTLDWQERLVAGLGQRPDAAQAVALILSTPEAQLG